MQEMVAAMKGMIENHEKTTTARFGRTGSSNGGFRKRRKSKFGKYSKFDNSFEQSSCCSASHGRTPR